MAGSLKQEDCGPDPTEQEANPMSKITKAKRAGDALASTCLASISLFILSTTEKKISITWIPTNK
jgi:hypothetical protein